MEARKSRISCTLCQKSRLNFPHLYLFFSVSLLLVPAKSESFNYTNFETNLQNIRILGDASVVNGHVELNKVKTFSLGRLVYNKPIKIWDSENKTLVNFTTHFSFIIDRANSTNVGDGFAFFLVPNGSEFSKEMAGSNLGVFMKNHASSNRSVAVEFDTFGNMDFVDGIDSHIGINVGSISSIANISLQSSIIESQIAFARIEYDANTENLTVNLRYGANPVLSYNLSSQVHLRDQVPESVYFGFAGTTGLSLELNKILSWDFYSTMIKVDGWKDLSEKSSPMKKIKSLIIGIAIGGCVLILICCLGFWFLFRLRTKRDEQGGISDASLEDEFEKGTGPKRFTFSELSHATHKFAESGKLGEGGFGGVYKGSLRDLKIDVAVKRVSRWSKQGKKEYATEVKIISKLRHRNMVQLIGWCHENAEFLLVYEFMPNGSLDSHLFGRKESLKWDVRYKIATGLASALLYLHEECEKCVVHRDIKSSNVMLDSTFNPKLGDFGLARSVDHGTGPETTVLAGTLGYLAPECLATCRATKESDVYSFGIVCLEIASGRKPINSEEEVSKIRLLDWIWQLYLNDNLLEGVDPRLNGEFDEKEMSCLMMVGLWCAHPDRNKRPTIRQAKNFLNFEIDVPDLPPMIDGLSYVSSAMMCTFSDVSTSRLLNTSESEKNESSHVSHHDHEKNLPQGPYSPISNKSTLRSFYPR